MSYDLKLGFRSKPYDLTGVLRELGFQLNRIIRPGELSGVNFEMRNYSWFDEQSSSRGVHIDYTDGMYGDELQLFQIESQLVVQATVVSYMGRNDVDRHKQETVARYLRDYYKSVLYDPQEGTEVKD